jgi:adenylate kinase family enzyme
LGPSMIIELFGPPGAGKTTFAHALTTRLRESGHAVELMLSFRPAEHRSSSTPCPSGWAEHPVAAVPRRLSRPLLEMLAIARHPFAMLHDIEVAAGVMKILPPRDMAAALRLSQYVLRLSHSWSRTSFVGHIVLFDQAFIQFICSLALFGRWADESLIARALHSSPRSDFVIRLDAPREVLAARWKDRELRQSAIERLFELDLDTNLKSIRIINQLHRLLLDGGQSVACASSLDRRSLSESVEAIGDALTARLATAREDHRATNAACHQPSSQGPI